MGSLLRSSNIFADKFFQEDLRKTKEIVNDSGSVIEELKNTKSLLSDRDEQFSTLMAEADHIRKTLFNKDAELFELKDTLDDQKSTIENQDKQILDLLQKQESGEKTEQYVKELMQEIQKEKEMVLEKDGEIQALLEKLDVRRTEGDGEDSESKSKKLKSLQEEILQKDKEIKKLKKAIEEGDEKRQELEQVHEINLQKTIHHIKAEMGKANEIKVAHLKAEHQAEIDKMLETSRLELTELGQQFEEQIGAAERVNMHLLQNFFRNRTLNESQVPTSVDDNTPVESLLNDLQSEAENIADLVTAYQFNGVDPAGIEELQNSWAKEKQILIEAVKALRELVAKATNIAASDAAGVGEDWRAVLLRAIGEVFTLDTDLLNAEIETLESIPSVAEQSADLIAVKRKRLVDQRKTHSQILKSLNDKDRESILQEVGQLQSVIEDFTREVGHYKSLLEELEAKENQKEDLVQEYKSQIEQELNANTQLRNQLDEEKTRNLELEALINNERNAVNDMRNTLESDEEKIRDLVNALEIEQAELKEIRDIMTNEQSKTQKLEEEVKEEKDRSEKYRKNLDVERKRLEEMTIKGKANVEKFENMLQEKADQHDELTEKVLELTEEKSRLLKAAELEQNHSRKIESLCEDLKSKAAQEKKERQRIEKLAERYQANLEELTKLFEDEKNRRMKYESALEQKKSYEVEAEEKGQQDAADKEKLEEMLNDANGTVSSLKFELDRAKAKISSQDAEIMSLQAESALKVAEIKKQNAEKISEMSDIVAKSKCDFADEIEKERASSKQLRDALNNLQMKFETSRSQYERLRQTFDEADGNRDANQSTPKSSPINRYSVSSRALDPFVIRCNKLVKHCQDVIANEQQRMEYGAERPSERHIKELQSTYDALDALVQELNELQQDLRALEQHDQCDNSPTARLEQSHKKNEELRDHIRKLVKEKSEFRTNLTALEQEIMEYRNREAEIGEVQKASREAELQLKSEQLMWEAEINSLKSELLKLEAEKNALERSLDMASLENANLRNSLSKPEQPSSPPEDVNANKVSDSGWSIQKIQKLYGRCLRAESFRKALIYQKKYLLFLLGGFQETEAITLSMIAKMNDVSNVGGTTKQQAYGKSRAFMRFRTAARVVIATWRMKFLVKKWSKSVSKITLKSAKKDGELNGSPSAPTGNSPQRRGSSDNMLRYIRPTKIGHDDDEALREQKGGWKNSTEVESRFKNRQNGVDNEYQSGDKRFEARRGRRRDDENLRSRPRIERHEKIETDSDPSSYAPLRRIDGSPPRAYPRPASPKLSHEPFPNADTDNRYFNTQRSSRASSRPRSPNSQGASPSKSLTSKHQRSLSASGLDETNTSLNAYIKKLEMLQAKLKSQGTDYGSDSRRF